MVGRLFGGGFWGDGGGEGFCGGGSVSGNLLGWRVCRHEAVGVELWYVLLQDAALFDGVLNWAATLGATAWSYCLRLLLYVGSSFSWPCRRG